MYLTFETSDEILKFLDDSLEDKILYFKNQEFSSDSPPHYHVALPLSKDEYIFLVMFSSQVEKVKKYSSITENMKECLLEVSTSDFPFLTSDSIVNCNAPIFKTKTQLCNNIIDGRLIVYCETIPDRLLSSIKDKIFKSDSVKPKIKKKIL